MIPSSLNVKTTVMNYLLYTSVLAFGVRASEIESTNSTLRRHKVRVTGTV